MRSGSIAHRRPCTSTNERAHWVKPRVVVEVKFAEWTSDGRLRQPIYLGTRDDKNAMDVHPAKERIQRYATEGARAALESDIGRSFELVMRDESLWERQGGVA